MGLRVTDDIIMDTDYIYALILEMKTRPDLWGVGEKHRNDQLRNLSHMKHTRIY